MKRDRRKDNWSPLYTSITNRGVQPPVLGSFDVCVGQGRYLNFFKTSVEILEYISNNVDRFGRNEKDSDDSGRKREP